MMRSQRVLFLSAISALFLIQSPICHAGSSQTIQIKGSDTMVNLGQAWAEEYMHANTDQSIAVTGGGSGTGIAAIIAGTCDIAESSRSMTPEEKAKAESNGRHVVETTVGFDGIAVVVHPSNPVTQLTIAQLSDIYTGKVTNWSQVGGANQPILILTRDRNSGTHVFFLEHVLRRGNAKGPEEFASSALMMPSSQAIVQEVKTSEGAIGYVGLGYVNNEMKVLNVAQKEEGPFIGPSIETILNGTYLISRPLFFYTAGENPAVQAFIKFVLSSEGQEIVRVLDFVPVQAA